MPKIIRTARVEPPRGAADPRYSGGTLLDSFSVALPTGAPDDAYRLAQLSLTNSPLPFRALIGLHDVVMARLGVKTSQEIGAAHASTISPSFPFSIGRGTKWSWACGTVTSTSALG